MISLLAQGNTGNEILQILDTLAADAVSDNEEDTIEFWCSLTVCPMDVNLSVSDVDTVGHLCYSRKVAPIGSVLWALFIFARARCRYKKGKQP